MGSGETLYKSGTFWKNLVIDAKDRQCFHNAEEDKNLAQAITVALIGLNQVSILLGLDPLLFIEARWKVCLSFEPLGFIHAFLLYIISFVIFLFALHFLSMLFCVSLK